jgi:hypothetical protein
VDAIRDQISRLGLTKPDAYNPYAAGAKRYGLTGNTAATTGPVSAQGQQGYQDRDREMAVRRQAVLNRMQAAQNGNYMSADYLRGAQ